jgi:hypothetical protein
MKKYSRNTRNKKKQQRKLKMKGGIIKTNSNLSSWQAVYNMITSEHSKLTSISYNSAAGFIFKLDVQEEYSEFLGLNSARTSFNEPVTSLIFKIVIIDAKNEIIELPEYEDKDKKYHDKVLENKGNFIQEAVIQQDIYLKTINPNGNYICPSVIDLSLFKNQHAKKLINDLFNIFDKDYECGQMLKYLHEALKNKSAELGMITMELVDNNYIPIYKAIYLDRERYIYKTNCEYALAELIILFIKLKLVNYDCHSRNILAKRNGNLKSLLIDFGRVIDLKNVSQKMKTQYKIFTGKDFDEDFNDIVNIDVRDFYDITRENYNDKNKKKNKEINIAKIIWIIRFIAFVDFSKNFVEYNSENDPFTQPQMNSLIKSLYGHGLNNENTKTFNWYNIESDTILSIISICNKIEELTIGRVTQSNIFSLDAMKSKVSNKNFFDNNIDATTLYRENRPDISEGNCDPNDKTCWTTTLKRVGTFFGITGTRKRGRSISPERSSSKTRKQKQKEY